MATYITNKKPHQLLEKLIQLQANLSDYKFALLLGVKRVVWYATRTQSRPIGKTILVAITRTYPELNDDVIDYLRNGDHDNND